MSLQIRILEPFMNIMYNIVNQQQADEMIEDIEHKNEEMNNIIEDSDKKRMKRSFEYEDVCISINLLEGEYRYKCWNGQDKEFY